MPAGGDVDVGEGDFGVVFEDAAGACEREARFEVPEIVAVEVGACICCILVGRVKRQTLARVGESNQLASAVAMGV